MPILVVGQKPNGKSQIRSKIIQLMKICAKILFLSPASILVLAMLMATSLFGATVKPPTLTITAPKTGAKWSNAVYTVTGTVAKGSPGVTNVFVSVGADGWNSFAVISNKTWLAQVSLSVGTNSIAAYAVDTNGVPSKTNTVKLVYIVTAPLAFSIVGEGKVSPDYSNALLIVGERYTIKATAAKGFGFYYWDVGDSMSNSTSLSFTMVSNLVITANFKDITPPTLTITAPKAGINYSNSTIQVTGTASDNVAVTNVWVQINGDGWVLASGTTSWTADDLAVIVGTNTLQAYAVDDSDNYSKTNEVKFIGVMPASSGPAPASITDTIAQVNIDGGSGPFFIDFGSSAFAQDSTNGQQNSYTGIYAYTLLSSNIAQINLAALQPPGTSSGDQLTATFSDASDATFTDTNGNTGTITLANAPNFTPSTSAIITGQYVDIFGNTNFFVLDGGWFTNTDGLSYTNYGTYYSAPCSPVDTMLVENYTDADDAGDTGYVQLEYSSVTNGQFFFNEFDNNNNFLNSDSGTFTILSSASEPAGFAPDSVDGQIWTATPDNGQSPFQFCFGISTDSRSSSKDTNEDGVGIYSYVKTGPNTAQLTDFETEPLLGFSGNNNNGYSSQQTDFTFTSASAATVYSSGTKVGTIVVSTAKNLAPSSLSAKTITVKFSSFSATLTLQAGGTFTLTSSTGLTNDQGVYTYAQYSPIGAMLVFDVTASTTGDVGKTTYVGLTFTSSSGGAVFATTFDSLGNFDNSLMGTFTIH